MSATEALRSRLDEPWLVGLDATQFWALWRQRRQWLQAAAPRDILLVEPEPTAFLASFFAACQVPGRLWLGNPDWGQREWAQVAAQVRPDEVLGAPSDLLPRDLPLGSPAFQEDSGQILIPTGGSSGQIRFAAHTWETLAAAVQGFQAHFQTTTVHAYCVLPLHHVSGLMQAMRCLLTGGRLAVQPFSALQQGEPLPLPGPDVFLSLVPTQLQRLLSGEADHAAWLRSLRAILLGGAPAWPTLLAQARSRALPLALTYGMTETAAQVATLHPDEFLAGRSSSGRPLPHAQITITNDTGQALPPNQSGRVTLQAQSLATGYAHAPLPRPFLPGDLGYLDAAGYLHIQGRTRDLIMTGGEKVLPAEVEAALLALPGVADAAVLGLPDGEWGEVVTAVVVPQGGAWETEIWRRSLKAQLSPHKVPKHWLQCDRLPRNAQGKLNRLPLQQWARRTLGRT